MTSALPHPIQTTVRSPPIAAVQSASRYLLLGRESRTGGTVDEGFLDLLSVVARASELIRAGYAVDIQSPTGLPPHPSRLTPQQSTGGTTVATDS